MDLHNPGDETGCVVTIRVLTFADTRSVFQFAFKRPLITALNQTIVPVAQRVTVVNLVCIPWTAYLAYKNCKAKQEEVATAEKNATLVKR